MNFLSTNCKVAGRPSRLVSRIAAAGIGLQLGCATTRPEQPCLVGAETAPAASCTHDHAAAEREWKAFRADYPGLVQGLAISDPLRGGCRVLIMAEPPPSLALNDLKGLAPGLLDNTRTHKRGFGVDGWTRDAVAVLPPLDDGALDELVSTLHFAMHGSAYGAAALPYGSHRARVPYFHGNAFDLRIAPQELLAWLTDGPREAKDRVLGTKATVDGLLADPEPGVYHTGDLVLWPLRRNHTVADQRAFARRFAVDSDLIVGALLGSTGVIVVGRSRVVPLDQLLPLRTETLLALAGASTDELAQSYERRRLLAGRLADNTDWAPAMLSAQLHDTEFGGLLNMTDNVLKSWSLGGVVKYQGYEWYAKPGRWPFATPLIDTMKKAGQSGVTFNWHTEDRAVALRDGTRTSLTFSSTGALPLQYIPEGGTSDPALVRVTSEGIEYFASLGDPNLARVAQYVSFFQIARLADLSGVRRAKSPDLKAQQRVLENHLGGVVAALRTGGPVVEKHVRDFIVHSAPKESAAAPAEVIDAIVSGYMDDLRQMAELMEPKLQALGASEFSHDMDAAVSPDQDFAVNLLMAVVRDYNSHFLGLADQKRLLREYAAAGSHSLSPWMHTPTIVRSHLVGEKKDAGSGGHNVSAKLRLADATRDAGGRVGVKLADGGAVPAYAANTTIRGEAKALKLEAGAPKLVITHQVEVKPAAEVIAADEIFVSRVSDGFAITSEGVARKAANQVLASEVVGQVWTRQARKNPKGIKLHFREMSADEVEGMSKTLSTQSIIKADVAVKKIAAGAGVSSSQVRKSLATRIELDTVKVGELKVGKTAKGETMVETTVEAVRLGEGKPSRWIRIKAFFKGSVSEGMLGKLRQVFARVFKGGTDRTPTTIDAIEELRLELHNMKKEDPQMRFEIHFDDVFVTLNDLIRPGEEARRATASEPA